MRILHINSYYFSSSLYMPMNQALRNQGVSLKTYIPLSVEEAADDEDLDISVCYGKYDRLIFQVKHHKILKDLAGRYSFREFDGAFAFSLFSNGFLANRIFREKGLPYGVLVQNTDVNFFFKKMPHLRKMGVEILRNAARVVFISPAYRDKLLTRYCPRELRKEIGDKSVCIPFGIEDFWLDNPPDETAEMDTSVLRVLCVSRLRKNKNIPAVLKACRILREKGTETRLTVIGQPEDRGILEAVQADPYTEYLDYLPKEDLLPHYRSHHIFALPSFTESFGLVYGEAMSQGLPVIYTRNEGFDGQFPEGVSGYAVDPHNPGEMAEKLLRMSERLPKMRASAVAGAEAFRWKKIAAQYGEMYRETFKQ